VFTCSLLKGARHYQQKYQHSWDFGHNLISSLSWFPLTAVGSDISSAPRPSATSPDSALLTPTPFPPTELVLRSTRARRVRLVKAFLQGSRNGLSGI